MPKKVKKRFFLNLTFNTRKKMPISLTPSDTQLDEESSQPNTGVIKRNSKSKNTSQMVDEALIELHSPKGVTLKQIYSFIMDHYNVETLSHSRVGLIKKHIKSLRESEDLVNKTGRGFIGHLKLIDKKAYIKKLERQKQLAKEQRTARRLARQNSASNIENKTKRSKSSAAIKKNKKLRANDNEQIAPVIPRQVTPPLQRVSQVSMFDTPMVPSQVHASTPFISIDYMPQAPALTQPEKRKRAVEDELGTPRTSLPGKKRRLLKRLE